MSIIIHRGELYRLYPDLEQTSGLRRTGWIMPAAVERCSRAAPDLLHRLRRPDCTTAELKEVYLFFAEVPLRCLPQTLRDLDTAYPRSFKRQAGYPRPKRKSDRGATFRFPDPAQFGI